MCQREICYMYKIPNKTDFTNKSHFATPCHEKKRDDQQSSKRKNILQHYVGRRKQKGKPSATLVATNIAVNVLHKMQVSHLKRVHQLLTREDLKSRGSLSARVNSFLLAKQTSSTQLPLLQLLSPLLFQWIWTLHYSP